MINVDILELIIYEYNYITNFSVNVYFVYTARPVAMEAPYFKETLESVDVSCPTTMWDTGGVCRLLFVNSTEESGERCNADFT